MAKKKWIFDNQYNSYFYLKADGKYAEKEWIQDGGKWYYLLSGGYLATRQWIGDYFVNGSGAMMTKEWLFDPSYQSMFYLNADGRYARNELEKKKIHSQILEELKSKKKSIEKKKKKMVNVISIMEDPNKLVEVMPRKLSM